MKLKTFAWLIFALITFGLTGCASYHSQLAAANGRKIVEQFRLEQIKRVEDVNAQYQKDYGELSKQLCIVLWRESENSLDEDASVIADSLIGDWKSSTLPGKFHNAILQTVEKDYTTIRNNEKVLDDARAAYAQNYQSVTMPLGLLKQIDDDLAVLSAPTVFWDKDNSKQLDVVATSLWDAYRKTTKEKTLPTPSP